MPFIVDPRYDDYYVTFNVTAVCDAIEHLIDREYSEDIKEGSAFWLYVCELENQYNYKYDDRDTIPPFKFIEKNFDCMISWCDVEEYFKEME